MNLKTKQKGFTLVELLIVIVVIAILAAISIVAYNGIQNRAYDSTVQSDLRSSYNKLINFKTLSDNNVFPIPNVNGDAPELNSIMSVTRSAYGLPAGGNALLYCRNDTDAAIIGRSKSGQGYYYSTVNGMKTMSSWPGNGNASLCPAAGIATTSTGYGNAWMYANGQWQSWFTAGS